MEWTLGELFYELEQDSERRILFVEGQRDLTFWREIVPSLDRRDTVIYPISVIACDPVDGGERGRLLWCAGVFGRGGFADRALFFADADCDAILCRSSPGKVIFTDGRDLESYCLTETCLVRLAMTGFKKDHAEATQVLPWVVAIARPIGLLRIAAERQGLSLPFQRTFERNFARFITGVRFAASLDETRLVSVLLQNASISLSRVAEVGELLADEARALARRQDHEIVHGKDFIRSLAWLFAAREDQVEPMLFLSLDYVGVRTLPNIQAVEAWITSGHA